MWEIEFFLKIIIINFMVVFKKVYRYDSLCFFGVIVSDCDVLLGKRFLEI